MRSSIDHRYREDPKFHRVVDAIVSMIGPETEMTSLDIRDACYLARVIHEQQNPHPILMSKGCFNTLYNSKNHE